MLAARQRIKNISNCFFLSKEKLYPDSRFRTSDETLETSIRQVIESQRAPEVTISWQGGAPNFHKVLRAARLWQEHDVEFNILTTVNAANADHPLEVYSLLRDEIGSNFIQFIPIVERINERGEIGFQEGNQVSERSVQPEQWGTFLNTIFDKWVQHDVGTVFVQLFDTALASWYGAPPALCIVAETCGYDLA